MQYFDTNKKTKHFHDAERFPQAINISSYFRHYARRAIFILWKGFRWKIHWTTEANSEPNKGNKSTKMQSWTTSDSFSFTLVVLHASFILPEVDAWANLVHCCTSTSSNQWLICIWFHLTLYVSCFKFSNVSGGHATRPLMAAQCTVITMYE